MKRILAFVGLASVLFACNTQPQQPVTTQTTPTTDTAGLAGYQQWKAQHELASPNQYDPNAPAPTKKEVVIYRTEPSYHRAASASPVYSASSTSEHAAYHRKGLSHGAKDAIIGGVGGGVVGALIDKKNRGVGGAIGAAVGAAAGFGIGHAKDKKTSY